MQAKSFPALIAFSLAAFTVQAFGQAAGSSRIVQSQPYSAEFKVTSAQTLADGTKITRETTEVVARDFRVADDDRNHRHHWG